MFVGSEVDEHRQFNAENHVRKRNEKSNEKILRFSGQQTLDKIKHFHFQPKQF